jgi:hypothetical protein
LKERLSILSHNNLIIKNDLKIHILDDLIKCEEHRLIFEYILSQLEEECSIYFPLFYLFAFISHTAGASQFFEVIFHLNQKVALTFEDMKKHILNYYKFILLVITNQIHKAINNSELDEEKRHIIDDIEIIKKDLFLESYVEFEVFKFIEKFKNSNNNNPNSLADFCNLANKHLLFNNFEIRDYFYLKYGHK